VIFTVVSTLLILSLVPVEFADCQDENTPWYIIFEGNAKRNGKIIILCVLKSKTGNLYAKIEFEITVGINATAQKKAEVVCDGLNNIRDSGKKVFDAEYFPLGTKGIVRFKVAEGAIWKGRRVCCIDSLTVQEVTTGQKSVTLKDPPRDYPMMVRFDIKGTPEDPDGVAILKIGETPAGTVDPYPLVTVNTYGVGTIRKSPDDIKSELVSEFNRLYEGTPFVARINCRGAVEIPDVPCMEGVTAGVSDPAMTMVLSMGVPEVDEAILPGVYSTFDLHNEIVEMKVRVVDSENSNMIYGIEILREDQLTMWDTIEVLEVPDGWSYENLCCGVRFYTDTDPLIQCQPKTFKFRVKATKIPWYVRIRTTDEYNNNLGRVISTRWTFCYLYFLI
jgi:hypothetical protein